MADEWSMKDLIDSAIREVNQHFDSTDYTVIGPEELKSFFLAKRPEDFDYQVLNITGNQLNLKASFVTKDITNDNLVNWWTEFEIINNVSLKIKTKKKKQQLAMLCRIITGAISTREDGVHPKTLSEN